MTQKYAIEWLNDILFIHVSFDGLLGCVQVALVVKNLPASTGNIRQGFNLWLRQVPWRRAWQPTPVFLPGESHGQRALVGYSSWGPKELDKTEETACMHARHLLGVVNTAVKNNCVEVV